MQQGQQRGVVPQEPVAALNLSHTVGPCIDRSATVAVMLWSWSAAMTSAALRLFRGKVASMRSLRSRQAAFAEPGSGSASEHSSTMLAT